jgi:hypothetical protein
MLHYTNLPDAEPGNALRAEWNTYRREVGRLLHEGHERKFALIKGDTVAGVYDNEDEATAAADREFGFQRPFMVQPIREWEPLLRLRGYSLPCRT